MQTIGRDVGYVRFRYMYVQSALCLFLLCISHPSPHQWRGEYDTDLYVFFINFGEGLCFQYMYTYSKDCSSAVLLLPFL